MLAQHPSMCNRGWSDNVNYPHGCYACGAVVITKQSGDHEISIMNSLNHKNLELYGILVPNGQLGHTHH